MCASRNAVTGIQTGHVLKPVFQRAHRRHRIERGKQRRQRGRRDERRGAAMRDQGAAMTHGEVAVGGGEKEVGQDASRLHRRPER
jgi:hypothetical protein